MPAAPSILPKTAPPPLLTPLLKVLALERQKRFIPKKKRKPPNTYAKIDSKDGASCPNFQ